MLVNVRRTRHGLTGRREAFEVPNGSCHRLTDPGGNPYALFQDDRPGEMERAYADPDNVNAIRV